MYTTILHNCMLILTKMTKIPNKGVKELHISSVNTLIFKYMLLLPSHTQYNVDKLREIMNSMMICQNIVKYQIRGFRKHTFLTILHGI